MELRALPALELNDLAWNRVKPERTLFGRETEALAMAELALEKASPTDDHALLEDTHARACFVNGLDDDAMRAAQRAAELAPGSQKPAYEARVERRRRRRGGTQQRGGAPSRAPATREPGRDRRTSAGPSPTSAPPGGWAARAARARAQAGWIRRPVS
jgi:hypothetical protein